MAPSIASKESMKNSSIDRKDKQKCSCYGDRKERHHGHKPSPPRQVGVTFI